MKRKILNIINISLAVSTIIACSLMIYNQKEKPANDYKSEALILVLTTTVVIVSTTVYQRQSDKKDLLKNKGI